MDLRPLGLSHADVTRAKRLLSYQPFLISDTVCTGCAYNWIYADDPETAPRPELYDLAEVGEDTFVKARDVNTRLFKTYQHFVAAICQHFPGASYLDVACNTGWMPIAASLNGMGECVGLDPGDYGEAFAFLTRLTGSTASFVGGAYVPVPIAIGKRSGAQFGPLGRKFDVVSVMEFMCHLGDPLQLLHAAASVATKAVFLWGGFFESSDLLIKFNPPQSIPSDWRPDFFWQSFFNGTSISASLLFASMAMLGFPHVNEVGYPADGLPPNWHEAKMAKYGPHRAFLFTRSPL